MSTRFLCATLRWNIQNQITICEGIESLIRLRRRKTANQDAFWIESRNVEKIMFATPNPEDLLEDCRTENEEILSLQDYECMGREFSLQIYRSTKLLNDLKRKDEQLNFQKMKLSKKLAKMRSRS